MSAQTDLRLWIALCEALHPLARPSNYWAWGASHDNSSAISGEAARLANIQGYRFDDTPNKGGQRLATAFLKAIADSSGSSEPLYHGFKNRSRRTFHPGQIIELPLVATSGDIDDSASYGLNSNPEKIPVIVFEFPRGTPMAGYSRWGKQDAKDFGHSWAEAIVGGRFRVIGQREHHRWGWTQDPDMKVTIVTLQPVAVFDPTTRQWVDVNVDA